MKSATEASMFSNSSLVCHVGHSINKQIDPALSAIGFSKGLVLFSIPDLGVLFKCRAQGTPFALEAAALCSALQFICNDIDKQLRSAVIIRTSFPSLLFATYQPTLGISFSAEQQEILNFFKGRCNYTVTFVERHLNRALKQSVELASVPANQPVPMKINRSVDATDFGPLQTGITL